MSKSFLTIYRQFPDSPESAVHHHMLHLARDSFRESVAAHVVYPDGSVDPCFEVFEPAPCEVPYRAHPRDLSTVTFHRKTGYCGGYLFDFEVFSKKQLITRLQRWMAEHQVAGAVVTLVPYNG